MTNSNERFLITRVGHQSPEAEYWKNQLLELVEPFLGPNTGPPRRRFSLPDDAIVLVAKDTSQPDVDGKATPVGSVAIKRLVPGDEQSEGLAHGTKYGEIKRMVVVKSHQGSGVAAKLLEAAQDAGKNELGLECILVETLHTLKPAQRFYEKSGFQRRSVFGVYREISSVCYEKWV